MTALRRAPLTRTPPAGPADDAAVLVLEAFDAGAALVDLTHQRLAWCSPGFAARCCVHADDAIERLEPQLPGLVQALGQLARPPSMRVSSDAGEGAPRARWPVGADLVAEAVLVRPGLAALRLGCARAPDVENEQATRRHLEDRERLLFTSRSLAVGEMASTLAHELNQPIGTVANVLRGMRARLERAPEGGVHGAMPHGARELLGGVQLALEQALFAARVIARIREYTHSRTPRRERLDLGAAVQEAVALLDWELRRDGVALDVALAAEPCWVDGDEVMLQQLFVNLLRNALEAMRDNPPDAHGRATRRLALALARERTMAVLTVRDNGCGLPKDANEQLFVPFQSTKPNGMGIGLNICRSFVELHQGRLWFTPNDDRPAERGCTFHVALPLTGEARP
jgi:two-component system, LuxR family, sensor kinase FixL